MGQVQKMETHSVTREEDLLQVLKTEPGLQRALVEFMAGRLTGTIEVHFNSGGICKVIGHPSFLYK